MTKYKVAIGSYYFQFDDGTTSLNFAELAQKHFIPSEYNSQLIPYITLFDEEVDEDE